MSVRIVVLLLSCAVFLSACSSHKRSKAPTRIGTAQKTVMHKKSAPKGPAITASTVSSSYAHDPFFDPRLHRVSARRERGFPRVDTTYYKDRSRNGFAYARIYADEGLSYFLDTDDVVRIDVFEQTELSRLYRIDGGGFVQVPLIGSVRARGLSTKRLAQRVAAKLKRSYIRDPKVTVEISTHRPFYILGEVRTAGKYPYALGMTIETAVAIAGGYSPRANERKAMIIRRIEGKLVRAYVPNSYQVRPGDTVKVVERLF